MAHRKIVIACAVLGFVLCAPARVTVADKADFVAGQNTNGWQISATSWRSPTYPAPPDAIALYATNLTAGATLSISNAGTTSFVIRSSGRGSPASFTARYTLSRLPAVAGLMVTNILSNTFTATWHPVAEAVGYRVILYTNRLEGFSAGTPVLTERFSRLPGKATVTALGNAFSALTDTQANWSYTACYYGVLPAEQTVQIGKSSAPGALALPLSDTACGAGRTLRLSAYRLGSGNVMPVQLLSAHGVTNWSAALTLAEEAQVFHLPLPALVAGDQLVLHSASNRVDGRVRVNEITLLTDYAPGHEVAYAWQTQQVSGTSFATNGLPADVYGIRVQACAASANDDSLLSGPVTANLVTPPLMPILRALPLSACVEGVYAPSFVALSNAVQKKMGWYNGVWPVPYWMGYTSAGTALEQIAPGTATAPHSGLYAVASTETPQVAYALSLRGRSDLTLYMGVALYNDTDYVFTHFSNSFGYVQWQGKNTAAQTNQVDYLVTNTLVTVATPGPWQRVGELDFATCYTNYARTDYWSAPTARQAAFKALELNPGDYLLIRIADGPSANSVGMGVFNWRLSFVRKPITLYIYFR